MTKNRYASLLGAISAALLLAVSAQPAHAELAWDFYIIGFAQAQSDGSYRACADPAMQNDKIGCFTVGRLKLERDGSQPQNYMPDELARTWSKSSGHGDHVAAAGVGPNFERVGGSAYSSARWALAPDSIVLYVKQLAAR